MSRPLIVDPAAVPLIGTDAHLPAVPAERLEPGALRQRFTEARVWLPEIAGDGALADRESLAAAVLVPLVDRGGALSVLLTRRTDHLRDHAGQISFPGGRVEPGDADAVATAVREAEEEIGLGHEHVDVIGRLPAYRTVTAFVVTPVIALVKPGFELQLDPFEVAEAFEVPMAFLMNPAHHHWHRFEAAGVERRFLSMPWRADAGPDAPRDYFIWGATAAMLRNLYRFLSD